MRLGQLIELLIGKEVEVVQNGVSENCDPRAGWIQRDRECWLPRGVGCWACPPVLVFHIPIPVKHWIREKLVAIWAEVALRHAQRLAHIFGELPGLVLTVPKMLQQFCTGASARVGGGGG